MPGLAVDAVFFARYTVSNYRALYGRLPGTTYTKDFFQLADQSEGILTERLGFVGEPVQLEYTWPGGSLRGELLFSNDRGHLSWPTGGPEPWRVGGPGHAIISIPGDPTLRTADEADAEYQRIIALGHRPWFVGVLLAEQPKRMHVRVYFENPPAGFEDRAVANLPARVRDAITALPGGAGTGAIRGAPAAPISRAASLVEQIEDALVRNPNVLLVGPPGTGKTVALEDLRAKYAISGDEAPLYFDSTVWSGAAFTEGTAPGERRSEALVFHPSYSYENFVAGLYPRTKDNGTELFAAPGPLLRLSHWVGISKRKALLILDEFNRGPAAAIFGDMLGLLDKDKRTTLDKRGAYMQRPFPDFVMSVAEDYAPYGENGPTDLGKEISLPAGVSIIAAMNSTDRSVAPLDAALRRRFHVIRVMPDYEVLAARFGFAPGEFDALVLPATSAPGDWSPQQVRKLAIQVLRTINERIRFCLGEDFLLGHALLWSLGDSTQVAVLGDLAAAMDGFVVSTLRTTFLDQDDALAAVLAIPDTATRQANAIDVRSLGYWQSPPTGLDKIASRRLVLHALSTLPAEAQLASLVALAH